MIKCDLHAHIDENADVEQLKKMLIMAQNEGVKGLGILSYNSINIYQKGGIFDKIFDEGIKNYYDGKVISAVEMVTQIDHITSQIGFDYYGFRADICLYDFDTEKLQKYFSVDTLLKNWEDDFMTFSTLCKKKGIEIPSIENFVNDYHPLSFVEQIMNKYPEIIKKFSEIFNLEINIPSDLTRNHITNPKGELFFEQKLFPKVSTVLKIAKDVGCKVAIAHPAYMSPQFDTTDYIRSLIEFSRNDEFQPIEYVCGDYMLNTRQDCQEIANICQILDIKTICGSDMKPIETMFYKGKLSSDKVVYKPRIAYSIAKDLETGDGNLFMKKEVLDTFRGIK